MTVAATYVAPQYTGNGSTTAFSNRLDPRYNAVNYVESSANSNYNALQMELQHRYAKGLSVNVAYTFAHSIDDNSDVLGVLVNDTPAQQNPKDNRNNRASSQFDLRHTFVVTHTYELPWLKNAQNRLVRGALGGWAFAGISSYRTGFPVNIYAGSRLGLTDPVIDLGTGNAVDRPNVSGPISNFKPEPSGSAGAPSGTITSNGGTISAYANSLGLSQPLLGNFGSLGRNVLRLNGQLNFDWNMYKNFRFSEKVNLQLRGEFYNIFNAHAFQSLASQSITSSSFGQYNAVSQNARTGQVAVRIIF